VWDDLILEVSKAALAVLIPIGVAAGLEWLRRKIGAERLRRIQDELHTKKDLALVAVKYVEQAWKNASGPEKYNAAAAWLAAQAARARLELSDDEIKGLIEWALRTLKDEFGNQWADLVDAREKVGGTC
jgi:LL-H family phage holin